MPRALKISCTLMVPITVDFYPEDFESRKDWVNFIKRLRYSQENANTAFYDNVSPEDAKDALEATGGNVTWSLIYK